MNSEKIRIVRWVARIIALVIILFGLPFYFGYGNPLPFIDPDYSIWENIVLTMYPLIFIGLALGWKYEKVGGYLITLAVIIGLSLSLTTETGFFINMLVSIIPGVLYLIAGYNKKEAK